MNIKGIRIAWLIGGPGTALKPGDNYFSVKLPFTPKANNAICASANLIMTPLGGSTSIDNYTDINPLPIVNGDELEVNLYNTGSYNVYNMSVSMMIMERSVY